MVPNLPAPITPTVTGRPCASRASSMVWRFTGRPRAHGGTRTHAFAALRPIRCLTGSLRRPLLASRLQHEGLGRASALGRALARQPDPGRAFVGSVDFNALAGAVALGAAERIGRL